MNAMVPWREIVGIEFLEMFEKISKDLVFGKAKGSLDYETSARKEAGKENWAIYAKKRDLMRTSAGYEILANGAVHWHGWFVPYMDGKELKFKTTSPPGRSYISLGTFLDFKRGLDQAALENEYYSDPDFPREE